MMTFVNSTISKSTPRQRCHRNIQSDRETGSSKIIF